MSARPFRFLPLVILVGPCLMFSGCYLSKWDMDARHEKTEGQIQDAAARAVSTQGTLVRKEGAWLGGHEVPLSPIRPQQLRTEVRMATDRPLSLSDIARRITDASGIPVTLELAASSGNSSAPISGDTGGAGGETKSKGLPPLPVLPPPGSPSGAKAASPTDSTPMAMPENRITFDFEGPLDRFLDDVTGRMDLGWTFVEGRIVISRYRTQVFVLHVPAGTRTMSAEVGGEAGATQANLQGISSGGTGSGGATGSGAGAQASSGEEVHQIVSSESKVDPWKEINEALPRLLTAEGTFSTSPSSGEIVVTDRPVAVKRVEDYVERKNANLTRQIAIQVDVLSVDLDDKDNFEIDWNLAFKNAMVAGTFATPAAIATPMANLAMSIIHPSSSFNGSSVAIKALQSEYKTRQVTSSVATTLNNVPAPVQVTQTNGYLRSVQSFVAGLSGSLGTSLVPGQITTGFIMTVTPRIMDRDRILLAYNIDLSKLLPFTNATAGTGQSQATIQIPNVDRRSFMQAVAVRAGDTLVLSGFEQDQDTSNIEGVGRPWNGLFGSRALENKRSRLVVLLTPVIVNQGGGS